MNIEYKQIIPTDINIKQLESLRYNAYQIKQSIPIEESYHYKKLKENKYLIFGCLNNNQLVGACYISNSHHSLYIEQLFISKKYQKKGLYLGKKLLIYTLSQKYKIEKYFNTTFNYSYLDSTPNAINLYQSLGYQQKNNLMRKYLP